MKIRIIKITVSVFALFACLLNNANDRTPIVELKTVINNTGNNLELVKGSLKEIAETLNLINEQKIKTFPKKPNVQELENVKLDADQDYFIKYYFIKSPQAPSIVLRLSYSILEGEQKKVLYILLERFAGSAQIIKGKVETIIEKPMLTGLPIDLNKLQKEGVLKKVLLRLIVDGNFFEKSKIDADPVFENPS